MLYPPSVFYPPIRVLSPHPCFILPSVFYPLIRVLSPHPCFIPSSVFYPFIRVLSPHPCFIPPSVFYLLIRVLSPHPYPYPAIRIRIRIRVLSQPICNVSIYVPAYVCYAQCFVSKGFTYIYSKTFSTHKSFKTSQIERILHECED